MPVPRAMRAAGGVARDAADPQAGRQAGVPRREGGVDGARLRVALGAELAREAIAGGAPDA